MAWDEKRERFKGQVMLAAYALLLSEALAWVLSEIVLALDLGMQRWWILAFGALTSPVAMSWLCIDAKNAYEKAASRRFLGFEGAPPRVISIADDCPARWLVLLHIQRHPELRWRDR